MPTTRQVQRYEAQKAVEFLNEYLSERNLYAKDGHLIIDSEEFETALGAIRRYVEGKH